MKQSTGHEVISLLPLHTFSYETIHKIQHFIYSQSTKRHDFIIVRTFSIGFSWKLKGGISCHWDWCDIIITWMYILITKLTYNCAHLRSTKESLTFEYLLVDTWWYWVSRRRYWLVLGGTGSIWSVTGWYRVFFLTGPPLNLLSVGR